MARRRPHCELILESLERRELACFGPAAVYNAGPNTGPPTVGDFNGDSYVDIAVIGGGTILVLIGKGDGTFRNALISSVGGSLACPAVGDFDGDGDLDLVAGSSNVVLVLANHGNATFSVLDSYTLDDTVFCNATGDFNNDGVLDVAVSLHNKAQLLLGNGDGSFIPSTISPVGGARAITAGHFNGDSNLDLVLVTERVNLLLGNGDGTFQPRQSYPAGSQPRSLTTSDFDGNGHRDIALGHYSESNGTVSILFGNGNGTFDPFQSFDAGFHAWGVAAGDFNGDANADIAVALSGVNGAVSLLLGNGDRTFKLSPGYSLNTASRDLTVGDFNGDGRPDITAKLNTYPLGVLINTGSCPAPAPPADGRLYSIIGRRGSPDPAVLIPADRPPRSQAPLRVGNGGQPSSSSGLEAELLGDTFPGGALERADSGVTNARSGSSELTILHDVLLEVDL